MPYFSGFSGKLDKIQGNFSQFFKVKLAFSSFALYLVKIL